MEFRRDIQGLRALSFIIVFIFHLNSKWLPGGFIGVDLFLVISGFLMTTIITNQINNESFSFTSFYINRLKRIVPAYYFFIIITAFISSFIYLYSDLNILKSSIYKSSLFISNQLFASGNSYFGAKLTENPFLHTWSLSIEMQFYFIFPILLYFFRKNTKTILILIFLILISYTTYKIFYLDQKNIMYFSLLARIPEFFIGGIFALIFNKRINFNNKVNNILAFLSLIILLTCSFLINELSPFPGILALIPCLTGVLLLSLKDNKISAFFSSKPLVYIGELSYSLYLWHFPIMALVRYKNDRYEFNWHEIIVISLLTFVLAYLSYNFVEQKFKRFSTKNIILLLGGLFLITNLYAYKVKNVFVANKIDNMYSRRSFGSESHGKDFVQKFGSSKSNDKILLIGDSHARSLKSFFDEIGRKNNFSFQTITCDSYPALKGISRKDIEKNESDGINFYETSLKLIDTTEKLIDESEVIILAIIGIDRPNSEYMAIENLCTNLKENQKLILVNSYPTLERDPLKINNGYIQINNTQIERESNLKTKSTLYKLANKYKNVFIFNLDTEAINKNLGYINDTVIYYDRRHLNEFGAKKLVDEHEIKFVELLNN